jgi:hypothetical protein
MTKLKKYRVSDTSTRFIDFLKSRGIKYEMTADFLALNIYLYCDSDLLQLGKDFICWLPA